MAASDPQDISRRAALKVGAGVVGLLAWSGEVRAEPPAPISERGPQMSTAGFKVATGTTRTGEHFELGPADMIFAPRGVPHAFMQVTEVARMMLVYQPAGLIEEFFEATAGWTSPPTQDEVVRAFAAHGMTVVGPPMPREQAIAG